MSKEEFVLSLKGEARTLDKLVEVLYDVAVPLTDKLLSELLFRLNESFPGRDDLDCKYDPTDVTNIKLMHFPEATGEIIVRSLLARMITHSLEIKHTNDK